MKFTVHTKETAPEKSKQVIDEVIKTYGFLPNLFAVMAEAPTVPKACLALGKLFEETSLNATEQQTVLLAVSSANNCHYCMAAHTVISGMKQVPENVVCALRDNKPLSDPKLEALRAFASSITETRGRPSKDAIDRFFKVGYGKAQALEVLLGVSIKTFTNYINHLADTPLDEVFKKSQWQEKTCV